MKKKTEKKFESSISTYSYWTKMMQKDWPYSLKNLIFAWLLLFFGTVGWHQTKPCWFTFWMWNLTVILEPAKWTFSTAAVRVCGVSTFQHATRMHAALVRTHQSFIEELNDRTVTSECTACVKSQEQGRGAVERVSSEAWEAQRRRPIKWLYKLHITTCTITGLYY